MKVTLEKVYRGDQETKHGIKDKIGIKIRESEVVLKDGSKGNVSDKWMSMLCNKGSENGTETWSEGMQVDIDIEQRGEYFNFKPRMEGLQEQINELKSRVDKLESNTGESTPDIPDDF